MYTKRLRGWRKHVDFILLDLICLQVSFLTAFLIRFGPKICPYAAPVYRNIILVITVADALVAAAFDTMKNVLRRGYFREGVATLQQVGLTVAVLTFYLFTVQQGATYSRSVIFMTALIQTALSYGVRVAWKKLLLARGGPRERRALLLLTTRDRAAEALRGLREDPAERFQIVGLALLDEDRAGETVEGVPVVANADGAVEYACRKWIDEVFFCLPPDAPAPGDLIERFAEMGIVAHVALPPSPHRRSVEQLGAHAVLTTSINFVAPWQSLIKRCVDILGGALGCVATGLVILIVGPMILIQSPGPLFFSQERVGRNGRRFRMYKLRSMDPDAEARKAELSERNRMSDARMFKLDWDPRVIGNRELPDGTRKTGIGAFIRATSIDEFPQFFNVLKGDMSLVGTRPPTVDEWELYDPHHRARLAMKPGITGLWQVSGRSDITDFEEVVRLDMKYICEWSLALDARILIRTVKVVLGRRGSM